MELLIVLHKWFGPMVGGEPVIELSISETAPLVSVESLGRKLGYRNVARATGTNVINCFINVFETEVVEAVA
jgi:hypothetical protein